MIKYVYCFKVGSVGAQSIGRVSGGRRKRAERQDRCGLRLRTAQGKLVASLMSALAEFERDLLRERIRSGIAAAKARGKRFGRHPGHRIKSDRLAPKVLQRVEKGGSYREIGKELNISKNTVGDIVKRHRLACKITRICSVPVIVPKYRRKSMFGAIRKDVGEMFRTFDIEPSPLKSIDHSNPTLFGVYCSAMTWGSIV